LADSGVASVPLNIPRPRPLEISLPVAEAGVFPADGRTVPVTVLAAYAAEDLRMYQERLAALVPVAPQSNPADSITRAVAVRASSWWTRLASTPGAIAGRARLPAAIVAWYAARDSVVRVLIDARLTELHAAPVEQSLTLATAVALFTDPTLDDDRQARDFAAAESYTDQLRRLPRAGGETPLAGVDIAQRQLQAMTLLLHAAGRLPAAMLRIYLPRFFVATASLPWGQRITLAQAFPAQAVAAAWSDDPNVVDRVADVERQLVQLASRHDREWTTDIPVTERRMTQLHEAAQLRDLFAPIQRIGTSAPPVQAHAWLNTPDSNYTTTPRTHSLNDGILRVLAFGRPDDPALPILEWIHRHAPHETHVVFVTATQGYAGPDLLDPANDVAQLRTVYAERWRLSFPIAIWAGEKQLAHVPVAVSPPSANARRMVVTPSPVQQAYDFALHGTNCVLVDGHGIIRGYAKVRSWADGTALLARLATLQGEPERSR